MRKPWIVDECPDANGNWTIRLANGTENGDTTSEPVATVYGLALAEHIVSLHNESIA
jgi:hypothetical protein